MKTNTLLIIIIIFLALLDIHLYRNRHIEYIDHIKTDTITVVDTLIDRNPLIKKETVLQSKYDTVSIFFNDTDTIFVPVEHKITQKEYTDDSTYDCFVSGCYASLDSIKTFKREVVVTNEIVRYKKPKFNISLSGGVGYGLIHKNVDTYVGITVGIPLYSK